MLFAVLAAIVLRSDPGTAIPAERVAEVVADVDRAEQTWSSAAPSSYSYTLKRGGVFGYTTFRVRVKHGKCTARSSYWLERQGPWKFVSCEHAGIADLFANVRKGLGEPMERIEWEADPTYGFPLRGSFQPHSNIEDDSWYFEVRDFKVRK